MCNIFEWFKGHLNKRLICWLWDGGRSSIKLQKKEKASKTFAFGGEIWCELNFCRDCKLINSAFSNLCWLVFHFSRSPNINWMDWLADWFSVSSCWSVVDGILEVKLKGQTLGIKWVVIINTYSMLLVPILSVSIISVYRATWIPNYALRCW